MTSRHCWTNSNTGIFGTHWYVVCYDWGAVEGVTGAQSEAIVNFGPKLALQKNWFFFSVHRFSRCKRTYKKTYRHIRLLSLRKAANFHRFLTSSVKEVSLLHFTCCWMRIFWVHISASCKRYREPNRFSFYKRRTMVKHEPGVKFQSSEFGSHWARWHQSLHLMLSMPFLLLFRRAHKIKVARLQKQCFSTNSTKNRKK